MQTSVWPSTFHGAEGHAHSLAEVSRLRTAAAYALIGEHKAMSPFLALAAVTPVVQDPQLYLIEQQLQQLRRALRHDVDTALGVLDDLHRGKSRSAYGPAGALRLSLPRAGLRLNESGVLTGPDLVSLDLCTCNRFQLRKLLQAAWAQHVASTAQPIDMDCTMPCYLMSFPQDVSSNNSSHLRHWCWRGTSPGVS